MKFRLKSGLVMNYRTRGKGRTIVLMHPIGCRLEIWDGVIREIEDQCRVIAVDIRGHGGSDASAAPFSLGDLAADVSELIRAVGLPPAIVAGCSMGGMVVQALAVDEPDVVSGFVIANTGYTRNEAGRQMLEARAKASELGMSRVIDTTLARWFDDEFRLSHPATVALVRNWLAEADPIVHSHGWLAIRDLDYADRLVKVDKPSLAIAGSRDQSVACDAMRAMAEALRNCSYREICGAGHLSPLEQPREFAGLLLEFMRSVPRDQSH